MVQPMTYHVLSLLPFLFFLHIQLLPTGATTTYNVVTLGAKGDGKSDSTMPFLSAWDSACGSDQPATVYVPPGTYLLGKTMFGGPCKNRAITVRIDGTLVAPSDYRVLGNAANWLIFERVSDVSIYGGTLDGQGTGLWACKASGQNCPTGATVC